MTIPARCCSKILPNPALQKTPWLLHQLELEHDLDCSQHAARPGYIASEVSRSHARPHGTRGFFCMRNNLAVFDRRVFWAIKPVAKPIAHLNLGLTSWRIWQMAQLAGGICRSGLTPSAPQRRLPAPTKEVVVCILEALLPIADTPACIGQYQLC